jgi:hypothetical protein
LGFVMLVYLLICLGGKLWRGNIACRRQSRQLLFQLLKLDLSERSDETTLCYQRVKNVASIFPP